MLVFCPPPFLYIRSLFLIGYEAQAWTQCSELEIILSLHCLIPRIHDVKNFSHHWTPLKYLLHFCMFLESAVLPIGTSFSQKPAPRKEQGGESRWKGAFHWHQRSAGKLLTWRSFPSYPGGLSVTLSKIGIHQVAFKSFKNTESLILRFPASGCSVPATL